MKKLSFMRFYLLNLLTNNPSKRNKHTRKDINFHSQWCKMMSLFGLSQNLFFSTKYSIPHFSFIW